MKNLLLIVALISSIQLLAQDIPLSSGSAIVGQNGPTQLLYWNGTDAYYGRKLSGMTGVNSHNFRIDGNTKLMIDSFGYVGIGTTSPARQLDVNGTTRIETGTTFDFTNDRLRIDGGTGVGTTGLLEIRQSGNTHNDGIAISSAHASAHRIWKHADGSLNFGTGGNRHAVFTTSGLLGIGTTSPVHKLDVNGTTRIETGTTFDFTDDRLRIDGGTGVGTTGLLEIRQSGDTHNDGIALSSSHASAHRIWKHADGSLNFGTGGNRHAVFTTSGNIGIGTSDPKNKLSVNGIIWAKQVKVSLTDAADWVFEDDYELRTLDEVENFIKINKHLPDVPSADEFRENDLNIAEMDNKLLQKIEELTLYLIEQNKKLNTALNKIEQLEKKLE